MIKEKTVFVFGAGLSSNYGFPRGPDLRDRITNLLRWDNSNPNLPQQIKTLRKLGFMPDEVIGFREQLEDGGFDTIDEFLEARQNPKYRQLGKTAMAMALISNENPNVFKNRSSDICFYRFLFKKMVDTTTKENFEENKASIVTYNYDRSFEFFLWRALLNRFEGIERIEADNIMKKIKIIHVHGMLGQMHWQNPNSRGYNQLLDEGNLILASNGIVNFNDVDSNYSGYKEARKEIQEAQNVIFVGFGFHKLNFSRLVEENCLDGKSRILATAIGIDDNKIKEINQLTNGKLSFGNMIRKDAVLFAREYLTWL